MPLITNDAIIVGILITWLLIVFKTAKSEHPVLVKFFNIVPSLLLCYIFPAALNSLGVVSGEESGLYKMATNYLLPCLLVLLTSTVDLKSIARLGKKALITFASGTVGIIVGAPIAFGLVMLDGRVLRRG